MTSPSGYRVAVNWEWTSKCNARCAMCPRAMISDPQVMRPEVFERALARLSPADVFRVVVAGYGEPTTHPAFDDFVERLRGNPLRFDMATNGSRLAAERLKRLDGVIDTLMISFSSIDPAVYQTVHTNLDQRQVMDNILAARRLLGRTRLVINLSPTAECLETLDATVAWFRGHGIDALHMSPTYYDRAGAKETDGQPSEVRLRAAIRRLGLGSQETGFIPSVVEVAQQWLGNRHKCIPRNTNMLINARGQYTFCFNDIRHSRVIGEVGAMSLRQALTAREGAGADETICGRCNLRGRYRPRELMRVAADYARGRLAPA